MEGWITLESLHDATSLGEASTENKGHGPETSRDADGQDRFSRHKALLPVAEGNTHLPLYVPWCQNSTREGAAGVERRRVAEIIARDVLVTASAHMHCLCPLSILSGGGLSFYRALTLWAVGVARLRRRAYGRWSEYQFQRSVRCPLPSRSGTSRLTISPLPAPL